MRKIRQNKEGHYLETMRAYNLRSKYGLTPEDYEQMVSDQEGLCLICETIPKKLVVDHCHETGEVRSLLCDNCNRKLGSVENHTFVAKAIAYLTYHQSPVMETIKESIPYG